MAKAWVSCKNNIRVYKVADDEYECRAPGGEVKYRSRGLKGALIFCESCPFYVGKLRSVPVTMVDGKPCKYVESVYNIKIYVTIDGIYTGYAPDGSIIWVSTDLRSVKQICGHHTEYRT